MGPGGNPPRIEAVRLVPIGGIPAPLADAIVERLSRHLAIPCSLARSGAVGDPVPLAGRNGQYDADAMLGHLEEAAGEAGPVLVGITPLDLGVPVFTFVFGRARHGGRAAVVSFARLDPEFYGLARDPGLLVRRTVEEVLHEIGHIAGLRHCDDFGCRMRFAGSVETVDLRAARFCPVCADRLPPGLFLEPTG